MKLAIITDNSAYLSEELRNHSDVFILNIPVIIDGQTYLEGVNLTLDDFYSKMATSDELPKTSQPSVAELEEILLELPARGYTHVIGLFLSSGISGFYQNIQYLSHEIKDLIISFPDTKITSAPLGMMANQALSMAQAGKSFEEIQEVLGRLIDGTTAFIMVDDLNHLVKGGRLSNGAALLGNLLKIKPILYFNDKGVIEVFEKVRTEKKAVKRLLDILEEKIGQNDYHIVILHTNALEKAQEFQALMADRGRDSC